MAKEHHFIFILGFGDHRPLGMDRIIKLWRVFDLRPHDVRMMWADDEPFEDKLKRITDKIDYLTSQGFLVSLVGISAGGSAVLNAYGLRKDKIHKVVFISGKLLYPETVSELYFQKHPAFKESVFRANINFQKLTSKDKQKLLTLYALVDNTVPVRASKLPGVRGKRILALGHIPAIYTAITFYSYSIAKFIKSKPQAAH